MKVYVTRVKKTISYEGGVVKLWASFVEGRHDICVPDNNVHGKITSELLKLQTMV